MDKKVDDGFSLIELAVGVGIVLTMSVGGVAAFRNVAHSQDESVVAAVAKTVLNDEMAEMRSWADEKHVGEPTKEYNKKPLSGVRVETSYDGDRCIILTASKNDYSKTLTSGYCD